ncbi:hypothetical protein [Croceiramulus getboli]|nr:hypothetical protein P8624_09185 [Flavobacteriaceae bacterium YJPT1-3]
MRFLYFLSISFLVCSCIPLKLAPNIKTDKVVKAKRFKRDLPRQYAFVFKDPKDADDFFEFINTKYDQDYPGFTSNIPFTLEDSQYLISFYERERVNKTLNLFPMFVDAGLDRAGVGPMLEDTYTSRWGHWYVLLTVRDHDLNDCLAPRYPQREELVAYLRALKEEYLNTGNYLDLVFKKKD